MRTWLLLLCILPASLLAQQNIQYSVSNLLRYGNEKDRINTVVTHHDFLENLTETKIAISDFQLGFRLLFDAPPEFGVEFSGIQKRYVEGKKDDLSVRAGNSFTLYGRGLALNLFENRGLAYDTGLDGIKVEYKTRMAKLGLTAGDIHYLDINDFSRVEDYRVRAATVELNPYPFFSFGANIVSGKCWLPNYGPVTNAQFDIPEYFGDLSLGGVDLYVSYAEKRTTVYNDTLGTHLGTGFYSSLGYTEESFGVSVEYKDYRFGQTGPMERDAISGSAKRALAFQNMPIVHKEHSFTLPSRYPHVIDFNDEVGFQIDIFYTLFNQLTTSVNFATASRHYSYYPVDTNSFHQVYASTPRKNNWLPSFDLKYSPFWEAYAEFQYYFEEAGSDYAAVAFNRRSDATASEIVVEGLLSQTVKMLQTTAVPFSVQYTVGSGLTLKFTSERQWVRDDGNVVNKKYFNHLFALGVSKSPTLSVTLRYEFTSDVATTDQRQDWTAIEVLYKVSDNHTVTLTAGGNRGGQVCANGVCRVVNPFLGFRASILSYL